MQFFNIKKINKGNMKMRSLVKEALELEKMKIPNVIEDLSVFPKYKLKKMPSEHENDIKIVYSTLPPSKLEITKEIKIEIGELEQQTSNALSLSSLLNKSVLPSAENIENLLQTINLQRTVDIKSILISKNIFLLRKIICFFLEIKEKAKLFRNLEAQNKYINAITNEDNFNEIKIDNNKRKTQIQLPPPQIMGSAFPSKSLIASEFNKANYMYGNEEAKKQSVLSPESVKQKSILKHRRTLKSIRMGFEPEAFQKKLEEFQHRKNQNFLSQNLKFRKKDVSFVIPEGKSPKSSPRGKEIKYLDRKQGSWTGIQSKRVKITLENINSNKKEEESESREQEQEKNLGFEEEDEIEKEIKFQRELKTFVKSKITYLVTFQKFIFSIFF